MNRFPKKTSGLPLPTRILAEGERGTGEQTGQMREVESRLLAFADLLGGPLGMNRRRFLQTSCGMAAAFLSLNAVFGPHFAVQHAEAADPEAAADRARFLENQLIFDIQTHFVSPGYPSRGILGLRELAKQWNPDLEGDQTLEDILFDNYLEEVFLGSDTSIAVLSNAPNDDSQRWFLSNQEAFGARERLNQLAGSKRLLVHGTFTPGQPGWMEALDGLIEKRPDAWKGYTTGQPSGHSQWPWRLDDEKLVYPAYEKMVKAGITTVCIHKGLLPSRYKTQMSKTWQHGNVDDLPRAAKDWPQLKFVIYHSAIRSGGVPSPDALDTFEKSGEIEWVSDLARIPEKHGVSNIFAEIGSVFAVTAVSAPRYCAGILGTLLKGMGRDKVLWGTDSVWYGSPQWQIEALRRLEMPKDLQTRYGFPVLGPADSSLKTAIFAENARKVYAFETEGIKTDALAKKRKERELERVQSLLQ
jgi:uncharacterized protein